MSTTPEGRQLLLDWMDTHLNLRPGSDQPCVHSTWLADGRTYDGKCGLPASWVVHYGPLLGARPHCEAHAVQVIRSWAGLEEQRASRKKAKA